MLLWVMLVTFQVGIGPHCGTKRTFGNDAKPSRVSVKSLAVPWSRHEASKRMQQLITLIVRPNGDTKPVSSPWLSEVAHEDSLRPQASMQIFRGRLWMGHHQKVRGGGKHSEAYLLHLTGKTSSAFHHLCSSLLEPSFIQPSGKSTRLSKPVHGIGVETVLDAPQRLDQVWLTQCKSGT